MVTSKIIAFTHAPFVKQEKWKSKKRILVAENQGRLPRGKIALNYEVFQFGEGRAWWDGIYNYMFQSGHCK